MTELPPEEHPPQPRSAATWLPYAVILSALLGIGIVTLAANKGLPEIKSAMVSSSLNDKAIRISMPYSRDGKPQEKLTFNLSLSYNADQPSLFTIVPDDCLEELTVNGKVVTLEGDNLKNRCSWATGFTIDLKPYLRDGINEVRAVVLNNDGLTGLRFLPAAAD